MVGVVAPVDGGLGNYIHAVYTTLLSSSSFKQHLIDYHDDLTALSTDSEFLAYMQFGDSIDDTASASDSFESEQSDLRPFVVIQVEEDFRWVPVANCSGVQFEQQGSIAVIFSDAVRIDAGDDPSVLDALTRFTNWIDGVMVDINGDVPVAPIQNIALSWPPMRGEPADRQVEDYWDAMLVFSFGTGDQ